MPAASYAPACTGSASAGAGGKLYRQGLIKMNEFVTLCGRDRIPIVWFQDTTGIDVGDIAEKAELLGLGQSLIYSIQQTDVPMMLVVLRKGTAAAHYVMGGPTANRHNAFSLGTPTTEIYVMHGETAAAASFSRRLVKEKDAGRPLQPIIDKMRDKWPGVEHYICFDSSEHTTSFEDWIGAQPVPENLWGTQHLLNTAIALQAIGRDAEGQRVLDMARQFLDDQASGGANNVVFWASQSEYAALTGDVDSMLENLRRSLDAGGIGIPGITSPAFDPYREDPRFIALLKKLNLTE